MDHPSQAELLEALEQFEIEVIRRNVREGKNTPEERECKVYKSPPHNTVVEFEVPWYQARQAAALLEILLWEPSRVTAT